MTQIVAALSDISARYRAAFVDLWGCVHDGIRPFPGAVSALRAFREGGGVVILVTNSPRPRVGVMAQLRAIGVPDDCWDSIATSGDSARAAMFRGAVGDRVHHIGTEEERETFFAPMDVIADPVDVSIVPMKAATGLVVTGPTADATDRVEDYKGQLMMAKQLGLPLLCANPDLVVDRGDERVICAGALALAYTEMGGESLYFGKPHPPIYDLARRRLRQIADVENDAILCIGDGVLTDIRGAQGEGLDSLFITGGLAAEETGTDSNGPDPDALRRYLTAEQVTPTYAIGLLR